MIRRSEYIYRVVEDEIAVGGDIMSMLKPLNKSWGNNLYLHKFVFHLFQPGISPVYASYRIDIADPTIFKKQVQFHSLYNTIVLCEVNFHRD